MNIRPLLLSALIGGISVNACALAPVVNDPGNPAEMTQNPNVQTAASSKTLYELMSRIDQLQNEVRELTGKVEEQSYQNAELKKRLSTMYSDFDERVQNLENKVSGGSPAAGAPTGENTGDAAPPADLDNVQPSGEAQPPQGNQGANEPTGQAVEQAPAVNPATAAPPPPSEPAAVSEDQEYKQAYDDLRNGRTSQSIEEFKAYLSRNPSGPLSGNAQYWLGEAYRVNQDFSSSRAAFTKVLDSYADSPKVPDALLKLGYIEIDLNNKAKAREYLTRVSNDYPNTNAARLAAKKLQSISGQ
ncbi:tol-pal system protein YbgF [Methylomicrobium sp. Wu6]|uniref:tol-pal system protein YbgF n=1 Tax=Methylomicrobium sp. Wu6 TaxID=3107928 RepID=UPI002DD624B6|nr:tol-pal system protein YbgF [Methylomicrobium sp. Wu6]MEC4749751.1 tol-pal system protein YbgF [Methylomicrobium sp. Wu6]